MMADRKKGEFHSIGDAQFVKGVGDMVLDGLFAQGKPLSDFLVAVSRHDRGHNFQFAGSKAKIFSAILAAGLRHEAMKQLDNIRDVFLANPVLALHDAANAFYDQLCGGFFKHDSPRAELQRLSDFGLLNGCGQNNRSHLRTPGSDEVAKHIQSRMPAEHEVKQKNMRFQFAHQTESFNAVFRFPNDAQVGFGLKQPS